MDSWINLNALWKIVVVGLLAGAGLPALFAVGVRVLNPPAGEGDRPGRAPSARPLHVAVAVLCFAVVLAAIGWGVSVIVNPG